MSLFLPDYIWMATAVKVILKKEMLLPLKAPYFGLSR
jgi:hypothetical protein